MTRPTEYRHPLIFTNPLKPASRYTMVVLTNKTHDECHVNNIINIFISFFMKNSIWAGGRSTKNLTLEEIKESNLRLQKQYVYVPYLLLPADSTVFSNPLHASTVHSTVPFNLLHLPRGEGDSDARHWKLRPADVMLWTQSSREVSSIRTSDWHQSQNPRHQIFTTSCRKQFLNYTSIIKTQTPGRHVFKEATS